MTSINRTSAQRPPQSVSNTEASAPKSVEKSEAAPKSQIASGIGNAIKHAADSFKNGGADAAKFREGVQKPAAEAAKCGIWAGPNGTGCCPPPKGPFPLPQPVGPKPAPGPDIKGAILNFQAGQAHNKYDQTVKNAAQDGKITDSEQKTINSAGLKRDIADKKVDVHSAQQAYQKALDAAKADGRVSLSEHMKLNGMMKNVENLQKQLGGLQLKDALQNGLDHIKPLPGEIKPPHGEIKPFPGGDIKPLPWKPGDGNIDIKPMPLPWKPGDGNIDIKPMPLPWKPGDHVKPEPMPLPWKPGADHKWPTFPDIKPPKIDIMPPHNCWLPPSMVAL